MTPERKENAADTTSAAAGECPYELKDEKTVFDGKWMRAVSTQFRKKGDAGSSWGVWQSAHRQKRGNTLEADGVEIIAKLLKDDRQYYILVKQFRIPTGEWVVEFPAGLIDATDVSLESAGIRELKEETGYTATKVIGVTCKSYLNPGLSSDCTAYLIVDVDGQHPDNVNPQQRLEADESIQVLLVDADKMLQQLEHLRQTEGVQIAAQVHTFALSAEMSKPHR